MEALSEFGKHVLFIGTACVFGFLVLAAMVGAVVVLVEKCRMRRRRGLLKRNQDRLIAGCTGEAGGSISRETFVKMWERMRRS